MRNHLKQAERLACVLALSASASSIRCSARRTGWPSASWGRTSRCSSTEDWKKLGDENAKLTKISETDKPRLAYDYSAYLALICGVDAGFPQAAEAVQVLLGITGGFHEMLADPAWRIVPRNALTDARR